MLCVLGVIAVQKLPFAPQRRIHRLLSPHLRQYGGASRACRRFMWHNIRNPAAALVLSAVQIGDNSANCANFNLIHNLLLLSFTHTSLLFTVILQSFSARTPARHTGSPTPL